MATIDTSTIEGFDAMTAEQKVDALLGVQIPEEIDKSRFVEKSLLDKKLSELAKANDIIKQNVSSEAQQKLELERIQAEYDAKYAELESKYNALIKKSTIDEYKSRYLAQGYDEKLAQSTAEALANGDMNKMFANSEAFNIALEKKIKSYIMAANPNPNGAGTKDENADTVSECTKEIGKMKAEINKKSDEILSKYFK